MKQLLPQGAVLVAAFVLGWAGPALAQSLLVQRWPAANATAAAPAGGVRVQFASLVSSPEHLPALPALGVYSAQRGGRRTGHSGQLEWVGQQLLFRPTYAFAPGEVISVTTWAARTASQAARPQLWQFTVAVGGTGEGNFGPGANWAAPALAPGLALGDVNGDALGLPTGHFSGGSEVAVGMGVVGLGLGDVDGDGDLDLLTTNPNARQLSVRLNQSWPLPVAATILPAELLDERKGWPGGWLVQVYPNPSVEVQLLRIRTDQAGPTTLLLLDALGRQVAQQQFWLSAGTATLPLAATQNLATGVYSLRVQQGSQQQTIRLLRP